MSSAQILQEIKSHPTTELQSLDDSIRLERLRRTRRGLSDGVAVYQLQPEDIEIALAERRLLLHRFADCLANDCWPCYEETPARLSLPGWGCKTIHAP